MQAPRPLSERITARIATGPVGHLVCGVADWAELMGRYLLSRLRSATTSRRTGPTGS